MRINVYYNITYWPTDNTVPMDAVSALTDLLSLDGTRAPPPRPHALIADQAETLAAIRWPEVNLALWTRALPRSLVRFARACLATDLHVSFEAASDDVGLVLVEAIGSLPGADGRGARLWVEDVAQLAHRFAEATGAGELHVHAQVLAHDGCRLFHIDKIRCRLITTYAGPGTEWLADDDVIRSALGKGDNDRVRRREARINRLQTGWVGLFKGERLPAMRGRGIVHRSAPILHKMRRRLVLKIGHAGEVAC